MARHAPRSNHRIRPINQNPSCLGLVSLCLLATLPAMLIAQSEPTADRSTRLKLPLKQIEPRPTFPDRDESIDLVEPDSLSGTSRRLWRDAESRYAEGLWAQAAEKLDALLKTHPGCVEARVLRARCLGRLGNTQGAAADLIAAIRAQPDHTAAHELAGEVALLSGDKATAIRELRLALDSASSDSKSPDRVMATLLLARALETEGYAFAAAELYVQFLDATDDMTPAMRADERLRETASSSREEIRRRVATLNSQLGRHEESIGAWQAIVAKTPENAEAWRELAHAQARAGNADAAFDSLKRYLELEHLGIGAARELEALCKLLSDKADCEGRITTIVWNLGDADLSLYWCKQLSEQGKSLYAIELLESTARQHPERTDLWFWLASRRGDRNDAGKAFDDIVESVRGNPIAASQLADLFRNEPGAFDLDALIRLGEKRAGEFPEDVSIGLTLGIALLAADQPDRAIAQSTFVTELDKDNAAAWETMIAAQIRRLEWQHALDAAKDAISHGVDTARLHYLKGLAHDALSEDDAAIDAYETAALRDPKFAEPLLAMARLFERNGKRPDAEHFYRRILQDVDPKCDEAREWLVMYYFESGRFELVRSVFEGFDRRSDAGSAMERCRAIVDAIRMSGNATPDALRETYLSALRDIASNDPDDPITYCELARTYEIARQFDDARTELNAAIKADDRSIRSLEMLVRINTRLLDFKAAEPVVDRLLQLRPRDMRYINSRIEFATYVGDVDRTIEMLKVYRERDDLKDHRNQFTRQLIEELSAAERYDEAVDFAAAWLAESPEDFFRRNTLLDLLALAGRHDEAVQRARQYHDAAPNDRVAQMQLLVQLQAAKRTTEAIQWSLRWLADAPSDPDLTTAVIRLCWTAKQWDDAIEVARAAIEETDEPTRYESLLSQTLVHARKFDEAIEMRREKIRRYERLMEQAVGTVQETTLALRHRQAQYELIGALTSAEKYAEAERLIDSLLAPMNDANSGFDLSYAIDLRNVLSEIYAQTGRTDQAIEQLETVYEFAPQDATSNNNLAYNLADAGRQIERAEEMVRSALAENPNSSAALDTLGWVLYKRGVFDEAAHYLRRALRAAQFNDPVILDHLGDALFRAGDRTKAGRFWERALKFCDPDGDPPPPPDRLKLHAVVSAKLKALASDETPQVAPLAAQQPTTVPATSDDS